MQFTRTLTKLLWLLCAGIILTASAFAADPAPAPIRTADEARRPLASDQKPGSLLVFNLYTSGFSSGDSADTAIAYTNTNTAQSIRVHLYFISNSCTVADAIICLTAQQTVNFLASDVDPGTTGHILAVAVDERGLPLSFNFLIGSASVKFASGHTAHLNAESYSAFFKGTLPGVQANAVSATLPLDGLRYNAAPRVLALDNFRSPVDGNATMVVINSLQGSLLVGLQLIGEVTGTLFDDAENGFAFRAPAAACQFRDVIADRFPLLIPTVSQLVPTRRSGWMRLMAREDRAISGAVIHFNPQTATRRGAFNGGSNLHHLSFTSATLVVPIYISHPSC